MSAASDAAAKLARNKAAAARTPAEQAAYLARGAAAAARTPAQQAGYVARNAPAAPAGGGSTSGDPKVDLNAQRDATTIVSSLFESFGLGSLAPVIAGYIKAGYSADAVSLMLQDTPEYKTRFAGNAARLKAGMSVLSPAEYLSTERAYGQIMTKYGLPAGFHDSTSDYQAFIEKDISAAELDKRAQAASDFVNRNDPATLNYFRQYYSTGDMIAFALDPTRAAPLVGKAFEASNIGGAAASQGIGIDQLAAEDLAGRGITAGQAQQGFGQVGQDRQAAAQLSAIYGGQALTVQDLIGATFKDDASAILRKNKLASQERASFGGSGGAAASALSRSDSTS